MAQQNKKVNEFVRLIENSSLFRLLYQRYDDLGYEVTLKGYEHIRVHVVANNRFNPSEFYLRWTANEGAKFVSMENMKSGFVLMTTEIMELVPKELQDFIVFNLEYYQSDTLKSNKSL